ncbi:MAG: hypothetical protein IPL61_19790 [Myxococcales bacterium]|nr:hypothetical protein [Myxococcales bacterium]
MRAIVPCGLVLVTATAAAGPTVRVTVDGACPDAARVIAALPDTVAVVDGADADVTIAVLDGPDGAAVTMTRGDQLEEQRVAGRDCAALAGAIAALADAWLIELAAPPPRAPAVTEPAAPVEPPALRIPPTSPRSSPRWFVGAGRALVFASDVARTGATRVDGAWRSRWHDARVRVAFDWGDVGALAAPLDAAATRQPWALQATVGARTRGRAWVEGGAGGGLVVSRVDTMGVAATRLHPTAVAAAALGLQLGLGVSVRLELDGTLYPIADRYTVAGAEVGRSPWATLAAGLGLDIALGAR